MLTEIIKAALMKEKKLLLLLWEISKSKKKFGNE